MRIRTFFVENARLQWPHFRHTGILVIKRTSLTRLIFCFGKYEHFFSVSPFARIARLLSYNEQLQLIHKGSLP